jgi:MFS family permease
MSTILPAAQTPAPLGTARVTVRDAPVASPAAAWFAVALMCLAQIISTMDRGMLALVVDAVRADLGITDLQIALLQGFAFSVFYVTVGLPLGMVAGMINRRRLLVGGIIVWSVAAAAGGLAQDFGHMFLSRLAIGVGEAVLGPCAVTIIADLFPPERRGRPMAVYVFGSMIAFGVGSVATGYILEIVPTGIFLNWPLIGGLAPWRTTFVLVGLSGLVLAALMLLLREPQRAVMDTVPADQSLLAGMKAQFVALAMERSVLLPLYGALAFFAMGASVATGWGAVLLTRTFGYTLATAGKSLGSSQILWAVAGAAVASVLVDRVTRLGGTPGRIRLAGWVALASVPIVLAAGAPSAAIATVMLSAVTGTSALFGTTMLSVIAAIVPPQARGLGVALYAFVMTMIGGSLGPILVATLTERVFASSGAVGQSMAIVGTAAFVFAFAMSLVAARRAQG